MNTCKQFQRGWRTRTHDLRFRKPSLYPAELQPQAYELCPQGMMGYESRRGGCGRSLTVSAEESPGSLGQACWVTPSAGDREDSATEKHRRWPVRWHRQGCKGAVRAHQQHREVLAR